MWDILFASFSIALTGALAPGPLLTFTIYKSLKQERGYLAGIFIVLGHATIEFILIMALLAGADIFFQNIIFLTIIGIIGGSCLITFGSLTIKSVYKKQYQVDFEIPDQNLKNFKGNTFLGGIFYSIINPYWELWWAVGGLSIMMFYGVSFANPLGILIFFIGHELGDIVWYVPISTFVYRGGKSLNPKIYKYILLISGVFMIGFGVYLTLFFLLSPL
jgi:threonine/homoserine/homoserine lactone efflux protein